MTRQEEIKQAAVNTFENDPSMTATLSRMAFEAGAKWADRTMVDKACELFRQEVAQCLCLMEMLSKDGSKLIDIEASVELFRKAMEQ